MTKQAEDANGNIIPGHYRHGISQIVAYTGTHGRIANAVQAGVRLVRVWCTSDATIAVGATPTAVTTDIPVTAKLPQLISVEAGDKLSAVQVSAGGNLHVTELH